MHVDKTGTGYTLFIQNNKYADLCAKEREQNGSLTQEEYKGLDDYLNEIIDSIPELKASKESGEGIGVYILPEGTSKEVTDAVDATTKKMLDEGTDENLLKAVLGIVKYNYSYSADETQSMGMITAKNASFKVECDMEALNNVLDMFEEIYMADEKVSATFSKFKDYINQAYDSLEMYAGEENPVESTVKNEMKNDLVDTLTAELDKGEDKDVDELKTVQDLMYEKFRKSIASSKITGKVFQQFG
ncbi:hypothetical protein [Sulfurospirillum arcachonense]|uniref:hypothetical protein n=1 Tax=Sulfurospirillum arcachonense TaxID=57666 RepID=UPI00046A46F5|nr:hypothetical protein [Sulfurospirillum arcachonense]